MADDSTTTIRARFETRAAADRAVEHLVQQYRVARPDIFVQSTTSKNTAGTAPSGGDVNHEDGDRHDAPLEGQIEVSVDIAAAQLDTVHRSLSETGAVEVSRG